MGCGRRVVVAIAALTVVMGVAPSPAVAAEAGRPGRPNALTVDGVAAPVGVDPDGVAFAWHVTDGRRGARQAAFRILVARSAASDPRSKSVFWDSGDVRSAQQAFVAYGGPRLEADAEYWWTVATRDGDERYWPDGRVNAVYPNGDGARDIPDSTELYPEWLWQYYRSTSDRTTLTELYPVVARIADYIWRAVDPATGLVTRLPGGGEDYLYGIVDAPPAMRYGYDMNTVARTTINLLGANALNRTGQIANLLGHADDAAIQQARRQALAAAINARLVRQDGVYVDGLDPDGSPSQHASQQANALALAFGIVSPDRVPAVGAYVARLGIAVGPVNGLSLLRALHASRRDKDVVRVLTDPKAPGWAHIVASGGTFTWESWTPSDAEGDSLSHGWGSAALVGIEEALLGVDRVPSTGAGAGQLLTISAPTAGPTRVRGRAHTIAGYSSVRWHRGTGNLTLELTLPPNAAAEVHLPARDLAAVTEDGRPVAHVEGVQVTRVAGGEVTLDVGAGTYALHSVG